MNGAPSIPESYKVRVMKWCGMFTLFFYHVFGVISTLACCIRLLFIPFIFMDNIFHHSDLHHSISRGGGSPSHRRAVAGEKMGV